MRQDAIPIAAAFVGVLALSGCASIVNGTQQSVSVVAKKPDSSDLAGVACSFTNGKGQWFAPAPGSVTVHRAYSALVVQCEHAEWVGGTEARSSTKAMAFGNILFGGVIGAGVDIGTGAAYDYPQLITVPMTTRAEQPGGAPPGSDAPSASTLLPSVTKPIAAVIPAMPAMPALTPVADRPSSAATPAPPPVVQTVAMPSPASVHGAQPKPVQASRGGQDGFSAARIARDAACHPQPDALMTAKGPGFETYTVACMNGDALAIRCEFGACRILR